MIKSMKPCTLVPRRLERCTWLRE